MTKWEYTAIEIFRRGDDIKVLNDFGRDGWEMVAAWPEKDRVAYRFKRPLPDAEEEK